MTPGTYLLDSDVIIDALSGKRGRHVLLEGLLRDGQLLACCAIWDIAREAGLLKRHWSRKGTRVSLADATIAAVALANGLPLITGNAKRYPMPELRLCPLPS